MVTLNAFFLYLCAKLSPYFLKPMIIDINNNRKPDSDGGENALSQASPLVLMVRKVVNSCKAMSSYEAATLSQCREIALKIAEELGKKCLPKE